MSDSIDDVVERLEESHTHLRVSLEGIPDEELYTVPSDGEWSVAQVCAHVVEMQLLWLRKAQGISELPDVGRTEEDRERRLSEVADHATDAISEITRRLDGANEEALRILRGLPPGHLELEGIRDGTPTTTRQLVENSVINHIRGHAEQIDETRRAVRG